MNAGWYIRRNLLPLCERLADAAGVETYTTAMIEQVQAANKEVYGIDLEATVQRYLAKFAKIVA